LLNLSQNDHLALKQHGLSFSQVEAQLQQLRRGIHPLHLARPCAVGDGILQLSPQHIAEYHRQFQRAHAAGRVSKFIPASGAATRMFKDLLQFLEKWRSSQTIELKNLPPPETIIHAWEQLYHFPFIEVLRHYFESVGIDFQQLYDTKKLGYANFPKALLPFHQYPEGFRTALEEHVREALLYVHNDSAQNRIHLTISAPFEKPVKAALETIQRQEAREGIALELTVSIQKSSTDTIALDSNDQPFRNEEGMLVFRPGGHGALLENLDDYQGDIVFISNIDNVVPDHLKDLIVEWRMSLAGCLLELQYEIFHRLTLLNPESISAPVVHEAEQYIRERLQHDFPPSYESLSISDKTESLKKFLNRPLRVCGVVPNTGDPGGGPFWVQHADGSQSRQIVEQSQVDPESESQQQLFISATHFNPVDLVCGVRDYQDKPFNLLMFRDPDTSFVSHKSYQGRALKALEWPGLWNGGMADWITFFVEIPRATFNPVKTFLDWLHPNHQGPA